MEGLEYLIVKDFMATGLAWTFCVAFVVGFGMVALEIVYGIVYMTLGLDDPDSPDILKTNPLRKYFFCFWEKRDYEDNDTVIVTYFVQGFCMAIGSPLIGAMIGVVVGLFWLHTFPTLIVIGLITTLVIIRVLSLTVWGHKKRITTLEDKE